MNSKNLKYTLLVIFGLMVSLTVSASDEYEWDGSTSSQWNTGSNWNTTPGAGTFRPDLYNINGPGTYTNAPIINSAYAFTVDGVQVRDGGVLTHTGGTNTITQTLFVSNGGTFNMTGGTLNVQDIYLCDANSSITISGSSTLNVAGSIYLGLEGPNAGISNTNGTPTFTITGLAEVNAVSLHFDDEEGDDPQLIMTGGRLNLSQKIQSDGEDVDISISGTAILDLNGYLEADGGSDEISMSGGTFTISGDWLNVGSTNLTGGTISFDGNAEQDITNTSGEEFYNLTIENTSGTGVVINDDVTITNQLNLVDGYLIGSTTNSVIIGDGVAVNGGSSASYIDGTITKTGNDAFTFPLGDGGDYKPLVMSAPNVVTDRFTAQYFGVDPSTIFGFGFGLLDGILKLVSTSEYWTLDRDVGVSTPSITIAWNANSGGVANLSDLRVAHWNGTNWETVGNASFTGNTTAGTITSDPITSFSPFTLGSISASNPLPIELIEFNADYAEAGRVELSWATASERNSSHFEIERSKNGRDFSLIERIESDAPGGNSNERINYGSYDENVQAGVVYYRLKQLDEDGRFSYSEIRVVEVPEFETEIDFEQESPKLKVYPNPLKENRFSAQLKKEGVESFKLFDLSGREVQMTYYPTDDLNYRLNILEDLPSALYILMAFDANGELLSQEKLMIE